MIGLPHGAVRLVPHRRQWHSLFAQEKQRIIAAIGDHILDIQHVGSTSIPDIPAKRIFDIAVSVHSFEAANVCIAPLVALGYTYKGELGIPRRHYFVQGNPRTHHVHMLERDGTEWERMLLFRDFLRANPQVAAEYAQLKHRLAFTYPTDAERYTDEKGPFIEGVILQARKVFRGKDS